MLSNDNTTLVEDVPAAGLTLSIANGSDLDQLLFKHDRIYRHNILRINYTTYDVRRKQDTINPATPHRDIVVLADNSHDSDHPFLYGRVIGIFHANVIFTGTQLVDYRPRRLEFLWVRWYELDSAGSWASSTPDRIRFPPMTDRDAFSFVDPADVLRACHVVPAFISGRRYIDGRGISRCAMDSDDWHGYYVTRCVFISMQVFRLRLIVV